MNVDLMLRNWQELIRPHRIEVEDDLGPTYGKFECAPLERGFGLTLGNALRRVLLSSLQGAAITSLRIDGVPHEFTSIPGVLEDVTDIVLSLKEVRLQAHSLAPKEISIRKRGPGQVVAGDFECGDGTVEVLNKDHPIATLGEEAEISLSASVEVGKGFRLAESNADEERPVGTIPVDSIFSPVRKCNYTVSNARVGRETDYDGLTLEVWTDGSIGPEDALAYAAKILKDQLSIFINFEEEVEQRGTGALALAPPNEVLFLPIGELELSVRSANCLQNADIKYIGELVQRSEAEMLKTKNFGRKSLNEIKDLLKDRNLEFGMTLGSFPSRADLDRLHSVGDG